MTGRKRPTPYSQEQLAGLCRRWQVIELALCGSGLCGAVRPDGDLDVLVSFASDASWGLFDRVALQDELSELFGREVHLVERGEPHNPLRLREFHTALEVVYAADRRRPPAGRTGPEGNG